METPPASEPAASSNIVEAPGWPQPGELNDPVSAKAGGRSAPAAPDPDPVVGADDGFRPYRAVYTPFTQPAEGPDAASGHAPDRADPTSAPASDERTRSDAHPELAERESHRIARRARGTNGNLRGAREREIAEKVRRALGEDELPPEFDRLVAGVLAEYAGEEAGHVGTDALDTRER